MSDRQQQDFDKLNHALDVIQRYVDNNAAYHYTLKLEFTRFLRGETIIELKLEDPDGEEVEVVPEECWVADACEVSRLCSEEANRFD